MAKNKHKHKTKKTKQTQNTKLKIITIIILILAISTFFYFQITGDKQMIIILETNKGNIELALDEDNASITTKNFIEYVEQGHYDGLIFHRVIPNFMIQGGGFTPDGIQKPTNPPIKLESNNGLKNNRGTIAMARTMIEDSATSQFFINVGDNDRLNYAPNNPGYAVFGKVINGMDVVDQIRNVETTTKGPHADWPVEDVIIIRAYKK